MGCRRQWLSLSVVQLKSKHCRKPHCCNGVVDTFRQDSFRLGYLGYVYKYMPEECLLWLAKLFCFLKKFFLQKLYHTEKENSSLHKTKTLAQTVPERIYNPITAMGFSAMFTFQLDNTKGQLISKCLFGVIVWTKNQRKNYQDFCFSLYRTEILVIFTLVFCPNDNTKKTFWN